MRKVLVLIVASATLSVIPGIRAQSPNADWEKAAGGKMSFDVASVKPSPMSAPLTDPTPTLGPDDSAPPNMTLLSANVPLFVYISFAYKLPDYEYSLLTPRLPKWAAGERFNIQARAARPVAKDQMRLMMQSLLAERFKLAIHWEKRQVPSYDLMTIKPGKAGPHLQPHDEKIPCQPYTPNPSHYDFLPGQLPSFCGRLGGGSSPGLFSLSGRNITMAQLANWIAGVFERPVMDRTGLTGSFDINANLRLDPANETHQFGLGDMQAGYIEGLRDGLGLKLEPSKASADVLVIDHVEEPTPN